MRSKYKGRTETIFMKGSMVDLIFGSIILMVFFFCLLVGAHLFSQFEKSGVYDKTSVGATAKTATAAGIQSLDNMFIILAAGIFIAMIASAFFIDTHPIFFVVSLIIFIVFIMVSPIFSNASMGVATSEDFKDDATNLQGSTQVMGNLPIILTVFGGLLLIALYAKYKGVGG
jgi:hypothetical protein